MEKDININRSQIANFTTALLTLAALIVIFFKSCKDYSVVDIESPALLLAILTTLPYVITFFFTLFCKTATHRKAFYATLGVLFFMTSLEWVLPKTAMLRDVDAVVWFFQTIFVVPFLIATIKNEEVIDGENE